MDYKKEITKMLDDIKNNKLLIVIYKFIVKVHRYKDNLQ